MVHRVRVGCSTLQTRRSHGNLSGLGRVPNWEAVRKVLSCFAPKQTINRQKPLARSTFLLGVSKVRISNRAYEEVTCMKGGCVDIASERYGAQSWGRLKDRPFFGRVGEAMRECDNSITRLERLQSACASCAGAHSSIRHAAARFWSHNDRPSNLFRIAGQKELYSLPFFQTVKVESEEIGAVKEDLLSVISVDETEPVRVNELVDPSVHVRP
jgi:hypothetical protein